MTLKQKRFIEEYLIDLNITQAAIRAGYNPKTAYSTGHELTKKPEIRDQIDRAMAERSKRTGITADRVLEELAKIGFVTFTDVVDPTTGQVLPDATEQDRACIQSIKIKPTEYGTECEVKLYDKISALTLLGRHMGLLECQDERKARVAKLQAEADRISRDTTSGDDDGVEVINDAPG